ncbi:MAG: SoxR reducing system RseC family protein [Clostridia bacterium]|nr:SoxR reducing system RseC family protein [Clostridia bacterium]
MLEIGVVEKITDNGKTAKIVFPRRTECDKCGMCMKHKDEMKVSISVKNTLNASVGDRVSVGMKDGFVLRAAFIVYVIPVILIGLTVGLGRNLNELLLFGLVIAALIVGVVIAIVCDRAIRKKGVALPQMVEIVAPVSKYAEEESPENPSEDKEQNE